ncbi:MAG TPA: acyltransferase [Bacteroidales bacterium]|nr:acyltransferase [Bacteroidales bacterium]HPS73160.1 acyltransferase [Bacteroidales bacterium]
MKAKLLNTGYNYTLQPLTKDFTSFLKGIAILMVILHNYYKWVFPITGENEFWFTANAINKSISFFLSDPPEFFNVFFNFLGFYGVQAFIVISAYGLTRSWQSRQPGYGRFILHRFDKLYPSLFIACLLYIVFTIIRSERVPGPDMLKDLLCQLALIPGRPTAISGPWWFYSFIFQFYLIFPVLMWINRKAGVKGLAGLVIIGYLVTIFFYDPMRKTGFNPYSLFIGHMPEFCLGIWLAGRERVKVPYWVTLLSLAVLICGNIYKTVWPFANLAAAILLMVSISYLWSKREKMKGFTSMIMFLGGISMYLFALHGIFRNPFINMANNYGSVWASLLIALLFIAFSAGMAWMIMHTEKGIRTWIGSPSRVGFKYLRFFFLFILVTGSMALFFVLNDTGRENMKKGREVIFSRTDDFEKLELKQKQFACTAFYKSGKQGFFIPALNHFSPRIEAQPSGADAKDLYEVVISAWLFAPDSIAQGHLALEVIDRFTKKTIDWKSQFFPRGKFPMGTWIHAEYRYQVPKEFRRTGYRYRTYVWNNGISAFCVDDLHLELVAKR